MAAALAKLQPRFRHYLESLGTSLAAPGGSSGGEAAAIAAGLSFLGIGSDIGGVHPDSGALLRHRRYTSPLSTRIPQADISPPSGPPQCLLAMGAGDRPEGGRSPAAPPIEHCYGGARRP